MKVEYKKDLRHNFMIISETDCQRAEPYCIKLLENQAIEGLLPIELSRMDNKILYYYDITAKQSMITILDKSVLSSDKLKQLCIKIIQTVERACEFLLPDEDFLLTPDYIYLDIISGDPSLCYLPGCHISIKEQMSSLMEYLMNKVDYNDKEAVILVYQLYALSREEGYTFEHLIEALVNKAPINTDKKLRETETLEKPQEQREGRQAGHNYCYENLPANKKKPIASEEKQNIDCQKDDIDISNKIKSNPKKVIYDNQQNDINMPVMLEKLEHEEEVACYPLKTYLLTGACVTGGVVLTVVSFSAKILYNDFGNRIDIIKLFAFFLIITCVEGYFLKKIWDKKNKITKIIQKHEYVDPRQDFTHMGNSETIKNHIEKNSPFKLRRKEENSIQKAQKNNPLYVDEDKNWEQYGNSDNLENKEYRTDYQQQGINMPIQRKENKFLEEENILADENPTCLLNAASDNPSELTLKPLDDLYYKSIPIKDFPFFIGKLKRNVDYCLEKDVVSRYHAKITKEEDRYYITDLNSTNGTYLNGEALQTYQKKEINIGDEIAFANIKFIFQQS